MILSLINTKFGIPSTRPALVPRQRLIDRLNTGIQGKLSLISAPAGYGKTTLAAEWLRGTQRTVTWLSLDEADNDPARFLSYFLAALRIIDGKAGKETRSLLQSPEPPSMDWLVNTLLNDLTVISTPFILALDDYQVIQTLSIHKLLNGIVEHQPRQIHLVLITREDPPFPLPRLRARGQIVEIRQVDLRFTERECAEFLENVMGLNISKSVLSTLERRTEGWIAGLQLASIAMQAQLAAQERDDMSRFIEEFNGSNRYVLDYLAQEVFERISREVQDFLLQTSILDQICASLCDAVTGSSKSQELLETLDRANLFIAPIDQSRTWYRYHRLFRDLLYHQLRASDEYAFNALHQRASSWYENHDLLPDAIRHSLAGEDWERALKLIHRVHDPMSKRGEVFTMLNWYSQVPEGLIRDETEACLDYSWILLLSGQFERAGFYLSLAEGRAEEDPPLLGQIINARAYMARIQGDYQRMVELSHQALSLLPHQDIDSRCLIYINLGIAYWHSGKMDAADKALAEVLVTGKATGNLYAVSMALVFQGMVLAVRGKLRDAYERFQAVVQQEDTPAFLGGLAHLYLSVLHYEWNQLELSWKYLLEAIKIGEHIHNDELFVINWMMMARIHMANSNMAAAGEALDKAFQRIGEGEVSIPLMPRWIAARIQYAIACDDLETASGWVKGMADDSDWHTFYRFTNTTQARYLLAQNKTGEASSYLEQSFERASREGWVYGMIAIRSLQALAATERSVAFRYLEDTLKWAQPGGFLRTFIDLGEGMEALLGAAVRQRDVPGYAEIILSTMRKISKTPFLGQFVLVEPLHPRELEVLRLMSAGYTNRQIAEELVISTGTAKTHVHNICGKLGARNRTEAAARARELGLIE